MLKQENLSVSCHYIFHIAPITAVGSLDSDYDLGRMLMLESCFRSFAVNFHFRLCNATSTNIRWSAFLAA